MMVDIREKIKHLETLQSCEVSGVVTQVIGLVIESTPMSVAVGSQCVIESITGNDRVEAEVVGFRGDTTLLMAHSELRGICPGDRIRCSSTEQKVEIGEHLLGNILDGRGNPVSSFGRFCRVDTCAVYGPAPDPLTRSRISEPLSTGIRAIDGLVTLGKGQRMGIFSGTGVGKSVLMGMIARYTSADVNVIALVGERGREVREFLEKDLGEEGLKRSVVVVSTSDKPALQRVKAVFVATAIAEYFRDQGKDVLLMMDSITRLAFAQREIGLSIGEPPATKGYPPSVFNILPKFLERAGCSDKGSITGIYTVLVESDDLNEPISDTVRGIIDGHVALSRDLASKGQYPAIDVLQSVSRVMVDIVDEQHRKDALKLRSILSVYNDSEDLINIGAYAKGANAAIDQAVDMIEPIRNFLQQDIHESVDYVSAAGALKELMGKA